MNIVKTRSCVFSLLICSINIFGVLVFWCGFIQGTELLRFDYVIMIKRIKISALYILLCRSFCMGFELFVPILSDLEELKADLL